MASVLIDDRSARLDRPILRRADQDGNVLDVIAALDPDQLIVTHVMPHRWKERP